MVIVSNGNKTAKSIHCWQQRQPVFSVVGVDCNVSVTWVHLWPQNQVLRDKTCYFPDPNLSNV